MNVFIELLLSGLVGSYFNVNVKYWRIYTWNFVWS